MFFTLFLAATKQLYKWYFPSVRPPRKQRVSLQLMTSCCINFAIISNGFTSPFGKKEKKNCHLYNTILSLFISRHYKKSLLRSQIYHGYEELSTDINYPIWRRQKLPYMKKTRKKKQVCGAACFMAAEIKFSEDVRLSVCLSVRPSVRHTFLTMFPSSYHHEIFRSHYQWQKWGPCKRSRSEVKGQGHRGHNPTLPFPDCNSSLNSLMMMKWCI